VTASFFDMDEMFVGSVSVTSDNITHGNEIAKLVIPRTSIIEVVNYVVNIEILDR